MYLGIDIGGSNVRIGEFDSKTSGKLSNIVAFEVDKDFEKAIKKIIQEIRGISKSKKIDGIGIALPGLVNTEKGYIESSANLRSWQKKPIKTILEKEFNTKLFVKHDVAVAAIGEAFFGFGKNVNKFIYFIWGTGFGGAFVEKVDSKLRITSFEPGHQIIDWNGIDCPCGQKGCVEAYIGGRSSEKYYGKPLSEIKDNKTWNDISERAAHAILNTLKHYETNLIIFGGGGYK